MYLLFILKIARAGLTLTGSCQYNIYADLSATIDHSDACAPVTIVEDETSGSTSGEEEDETSGSTSGEVDETRGGLSIGVYDEWPGISITLSVFLQVRRLTWSGISLIIITELYLMNRQI